MNASEQNSMNDVFRGQVYYIMPSREEPTPSTFEGGRPAVIVSNDMNNNLNGIVEIVYLTRNPRENLPTNVSINSTGTNSKAICSQIYTITKKRIGKYVSECTPIEMENIEMAMLLGLEIKIDMKNKSISKYLEAWYEEAKVCNDSVNRENHSSDSEKPKIIQNLDDFIGKDNIENNPLYIKACAERDVFKELYKESLAKQ